MTRALWRSRWPDVLAADLTLGRRHHCFRGEAELRLQRLERGRGAEGTHCDDLPGCAGPSIPSERGRLLDHHACGDLGREHVVPVAVTLPIEQFPRRHTDHTCLDAFT